MHSNKLAQGAERTQPIVETSPGVRGDPAIAMLDTFTFLKKPFLAFSSGSRSKTKPRPTLFYFSVHSELVHHYQKNR
jgi:hypothetical protein